MLSAHEKCGRKVAADLNMAKQQNGVATRAAYLAQSLTDELPAANGASPSIKMDSSTRLQSHHSVDILIATMSYRTTGQASSLRNQSLSGSASTQSSALQQRISEKKLELESLKQLRDLSAGLAGQMEQLEEKLATLSNGTEGERCFGISMFLFLT